MGDLDGAVLFDCLNKWIQVGKLIVVVSITLIYGGTIHSEINFDLCVKFLSNGYRSYNYADS